MPRLLLLCCILWLASCSPQNEPVPAPEDPAAESRFANVAEDVAFVGDAACFDCHEDQYRGYEEHGMARSFYPMTPENAVEDFTGAARYHAASDLYYRAYREGDRFFQEEYRQAGGRRTHHLVREMQYVVGSGTAARTYLTEVQGRLYELPLTWYTQPRKWDFSPGYAAHNGRFDRLIPNRCMACHNSYPEAVAFTDGKYTSVPEGIGCERCHGPGAAHVEARLAVPEASGEVDETIVNPAHLSLDRRLDVCQQCHLHADVSMLREGREPFSFRPSQDLANFVALFSSEPQAVADERIDVISHADRMKQSACFLATQGTPQALECTTCHDPHAGFRTKGPDYFNATCRECHAPDALQEAFTTADARTAHTAEANCYSCHMPRVEAEDAPHASFTDHKIRVVKKKGGGLAAAGTVEAVHLTPYFARDAKQGPDAALYAGMAFVIHGQQAGRPEALQKGVTVLEEALAAQPDHGEAQFLLGLAHQRLGQNARAVAPLEAAVRLNPDVPERLNALAQTYEAERRDAATIERLYQRALQLQPALAEVRLNYGRFLESRGRGAEAITAYRRAADEQPWLAAARYNLGSAYLRNGQPDAGEAALREALALDPDHALTLTNLGLYYAQQGDALQARTFLERAVTAAPEEPLALGNLGAFLLNEAAPVQAIPVLRRAVAADPRYVEAWVNLALAYFADDQLPQARQAAEQALQVDPRNARARQILGALR